MNLCYIGYTSSFDFEQPLIDSAVISNMLSNKVLSFPVTLSGQHPPFWSSWNQRIADGCGIALSVCVLPKQTGCLGKHTRMLQKRRPAGVRLPCPAAKCYKLLYSSSTQQLIDSGPQQKVLLKLYRVCFGFRVTESSIQLKLYISPPFFPRKNIQFPRL